MRDQCLAWLRQSPSVVSETSTQLESHALISSSSTAPVRLTAAVTRSLNSCSQESNCLLPADDWRLQRKGGGGAALCSEDIVGCRQRSQ